jgi:hypothetical protein
MSPDRDERVCQKMTVGSFPKREILRVGLSEIPPVTGWLREVTLDTEFQSSYLLDLAES